MNFDFDESFSVLNEIINKEGYFTKVKTTNLSNKLLESLKAIENCFRCRNNIDGEFRESINEIEYYLVELEGEEEEREKEEITNELNGKLIEMDDELISEILCESCKKELEKLTGKCGNKEIARFLHIHELGHKWISFNEFRNIEYLAKGEFGEVHKAIWIGYYDEYTRKYKEYKEREVVLKRIYYSSNKVSDFLEEVKNLIIYYSF